MSDNRYYVIEITALSGKTKEEAQVVADKLMDTFCDMPGTEGCALTSSIEEKEG